MTQLAVSRVDPQTPGTHENMHHGMLLPNQPSKSMGTCPVTGLPMEQMMAQCMKDGTPGEMHKHLEGMVGTWNAQVTMYMPGSTEPMTSTGKMVTKAIQGGRFTLSEFTGEMMGQPFTGTLLCGYNNVEQRFENVWIDSMSTGMQFSTGEPSVDGKSVTYLSTMRMNIPTPPGGKFTMTQRQVVKHISPDECVVEFYQSAGAMAETKAMEIRYTREPMQ
ncbi:MAG TPA: DUF1579 domain-containing protein [Polyangiaceae bacterium]|nr:DUF1579 domain-containing protein [Polyangiaceae bacterium]